MTTLSTTGHPTWLVNAPTINLDALTDRQRAGTSCAGTASPRCPIGGLGACECCAGMQGVPTVGVSLTSYPTCGISVGAHQLHAAYSTGSAFLGDARRAVTVCLHRWRLEGAADAAALVVSELLGNAVRHGCQYPTDTATLLLTAVPGRWLLIEVHDPSPATPALITAGPESECGRGLALVDALSSGWGWTNASDGGKYVWSTLDAGAAA
ncbi:ATP-binding protein [Streptomyces murinus]|uniref:ATP-binding protein n=1 Tax=Streptomyces murinus TaxID=33900 RepID=UPI003808A63C